MARKATAPPPIRVGDIVLVHCPRHFKGPRPGIVTYASGGVDEAISVHTLLSPDDDLHVSWHTFGTCIPVLLPDQNHPAKSGWNACWAERK